MQQYSFKRGFTPSPERILELVRKHFPGEIKNEGSRYTLSYGALKRMAVWIENRKLCVETESDPGARDEATLDTNKRFRRFLEEATGYTAKQRLEMAKKEVQG